MTIITLVLLSEMLFLSACEESGETNVTVFDTLVFTDTLVYTDTVSYVDTVSFVDTIYVEDKVYIIDHPGRLHFLETETSVALYMRDQLITSYIFEDTLRKQVFFPVNLPSGRDFVRSYPVAYIQGEATDHPHHIGLWFTYGEVNEVDFWTTNWDNYDGVNLRHGQIVHKGINYEKISDSSVVYRSSSSWQNIHAEELLDESTETYFTLGENQLIIDRFTHLTAKEDIDYKDSKEGMYAIRVAKELQENQTGKYINSDGLETEQNVWGKRARWMNLEGEMDSVDVSVLFIDHPDNVGYPAHWMSRGYGLYSINPLGRAAFTNGAESLDFSMTAGETTTFKYRIVISEKAVADEEIESLFDDFSNK